MYGHQREGAGRTEAPEVRCDLTDRQTDTHTHTATTVTLAAHARRGLKIFIYGNWLIVQSCSDMWFGCRVDASHCSNV